MANDETWSAKVSPEVKAEISQLVQESGVSSKEFLEQLISAHKIGLLQSTDAQRSEDIQQVTYHLDKIKASFIGLVEKGIDLKDKFAESLAQESMLHKGIVDQQQSQIKQAQDDRDKAVFEKADLEKRMAEIAARNEELESNNKANRITIQMQQDKLDQIEDQAGTIQTLNDEIARLKNAADELGKEVQGYKHELEQAQATFEAQERDAAKAHEHLGQAHESELQKARLEAENRLLAEIGKIKEEHYLKVEALTTKNQELTEKLLHQKELEATKARNKTKATPAPE
jgi:chromosome segregation ATPase